MADPRGAERCLGDPADGNDPAPGCEFLEERTRHFDLVGPWTAVGVRVAEPMRMSGNDVPEQHVLLEAELVEHAVDDRRGRFGRPVPGQLALGGEGDAADTRATVA